MADLNNVDELFAIAGSAGSYTIASGTYDLSAKSGGGADLDFSANITLIPVGGNVIIDGADTHDVVFANATYVIGDTTGAYTITFTQMANNGARVQGNSVNVIATFHYCLFTEAPAQSGLYIDSGAGFTALVTCHNCQANNNAVDGFTIKRLLGASDDLCRLVLYDCQANDNGDNGTTSHNVNHYTYIIGGSYSGNLGANSMGQHVHVDGGNLSITGGCVTSGKGYSVAITPGGWLFIDGASFTTEAEWNYSTIKYEGGEHCIIRNAFIDQNFVRGHAIYIVSSSWFELSHSIIVNIDYGSRYGVSLDGAGYAIIDHCVFYDVFGGISVNNAAVYPMITNSIFHTCDYGIVDHADNHYDAQPENGYNTFYNCSMASVHKGSLMDSDIEADPLFVDAANGNFRLQSASPCLNTGKRTVEDGYTNRGAWQPEYETEPNSIYNKIRNTIFGDL